MGLQVVKRNGEKEDVRFDAIQEKLVNLSHDLNKEWVDPGMLTKLVIEGLYDGVTTSELDDLAAETAASLAAQHPDYSKLAARICVDNLHRSTKDVFSEVIYDLRNYTDPESGKFAPLISEEIYDIIMKNKETGTLCLYVLVEKHNYIENQRAEKILNDLNSIVKLYDTLNNENIENKKKIVELEESKGVVGG